MTDGFIFYSSFYEALQELNPEEQLEAFNIICRYGLYGEEPQGNGTVKAIFSLVRPQIDANNRRRENGRRGATVTNGKRSANSRQTVGNASANGRQDAGTYAAKEKVKEKVKGKEIARARATHKKPSFRYAEQREFSPELETELIEMGFK